MSFFLLSSIVRGKKVFSGKGGGEGKKAERGVGSNREKELKGMVIEGRVRKGK